MEQTATGTSVTRAVVYAGRFADRVGSLPEGYTVLDDWEVLPASLAAAVERASTFVVLDPLSFPFEALADIRRDVPQVLVLPAGFDADFLVKVFGEVAFRPMDFFDRVASADAGLLGELGQRYGWAGCQLVEIESREPEGALQEILRLLGAEDEVPAFFGEDDGRYEVSRYWSERGAELAASSPYRAVCSVHHGPDFNKAIHRAQRAVIEPQFAAARGSRAEDVPFDVLEVGAGVGRWASGFDLAKTRFYGVDISEGMISAARYNYPGCRFDLLGEDLVFPYEDESLDLTFSVTVMHHNPTPVKKNLISEMWRVAKPGGRLIFLEDFVVGGWTERSTVYPMSVLRFVDVLLEATNGQVILEHVESLRYPHDDMTRGGLLALSKIGVPKKW